MTERASVACPVDFERFCEPLPVRGEQHDVIAGLLGREPRGLLGIVVQRRNGAPVVIGVDSLVDEQPFPTLFWLVDPVFNYRIDQLEAGGAIARLQAEVDADAALQEAMRDDHRTYIDARARLMSAAARDVLQQKDMLSALQERGVGGLYDFGRIRCLHTWYAAHLVVPNSIGVLVEKYFPELLFSPA